MHKVKSGQAVRILTICVAVDAENEWVDDEMSALLSENGVCNEKSAILDWMYATEYRPTLIADENPEEGEIFNSVVISVEAKEDGENPSGYGRCIYNHDHKAEEHLCTYHN